MYKTCHKPLFGYLSCENGTIMQTGTICKKIYYHMRDLKILKYFEVMLTLYFAGQTVSQFTLMVRRT